MSNLDLDEILSLQLEETEKITRPIVMYGTGGYGSGALKILRQHNVIPIAVCDSNPDRFGEKFFGYTIMSFEKVLDEFNDFDVLIASGKYYDEIREYVLKFIPSSRISVVNFFDGCSAENFAEFVIENKEKLDNVYNNLADDKSREVMINIIKGKLTNSSIYFEKAYTPGQYFNELTSLSNDECFVDGGAYTGDTLKEFITLINNKYRKVYSFEPSEKSFEQLKETKEKECNNDERISLFRQGLYSCNKILSFNDEIGDGGDKIVDETKINNTIEVVSIDDVIKDKVTFIKMDVEGSELEALKGARDTILRNKPKLAICVYHKTDDLVKIPEFIMNLGLDYKFYLRHHGVSPSIINETVFYAI